MKYYKAQPYNMEHTLCVCVLMTLYEDLFNGNKLSFDLTKGQPCFRMNKDFTVLNINNFQRKIKTKYQEGNDDEYFK